jgi:putative glutathione S-transferase
MPAPRYAGPVDTARFGEYRIHRRPDDPRPLLRFHGRVGVPTAGRYHVYGGAFCPWSQRVDITRRLAGLTDVVSLSHVDDERDGRGWAFRPARGPDPVNGFALLREAFDATEPGFDGHVSVPALWDREHRRLVSNDSDGIAIDLATRFTGVATPLVDTYPVALRPEIDALHGWLGPAVNNGASLAARHRVGGVAAAARGALLWTFATLDRRLGGSRFLLGEDITQADIRLWVALVRFDVGANATREINPGLAAYPNLWAYARDLYRVPAFRDTTDFAAFARPGAEIPDWNETPERVAA